MAESQTSFAPQSDSVVKEHERLRKKFITNTGISLPAWRKVNNDGIKENIQVVGASAEFEPEADGEASERDDGSEQRINLIQNLNGHAIQEEPVRKKPVDHVKRAAAKIDAVKHNILKRRNLQDIYSEKIPERPSS